MRITKYRTELNDDMHNVLVKEKSCNYVTENSNSPEAITDMINTIYRVNRQAEEHLYMVAFNTKNKVLGVFELSHGTVNSSICNPRDIFIKALLCGASTIALAHNHPSKDTTPSSDDILVYKRVCEAGKMIGIELLDNIVIGDGFYSFKQNELEIN